MSADSAHSADSADSAAGASGADRWSRGLAALQDVEGVETPAILGNLADIAPDLARLTIEFGYGDVYVRPGLTRRERQLATVAALAAMGTAPAQLRFHVAGALNVGCSAQEIVEALVHVCLYAGFPATLNAMAGAKEVFAARGLLPVTDGSTDGTSAAASQPAPGHADPTGRNRYDHGWDVLTAVDGHVGQAVVSSLADICPDLGRYLVEFAFGDVYPRPGLDLRVREIITVAACTALGRVTPQLKVHIHGLLNVGGTRQELVETIVQMAVYAGFPAALNAMTAAREVLDERGSHGQD